MLRRNRAYLSWLVSDTAVALATAVLGFALPLVALVLTDDPRAAGVVGAAGLVSRVATTIGGGLLADRRALRL